jgi:multidrug efflux pump subunit AcrB
LPRFQSILPDDVEVSYQFDQSPYVTRAIQGLFVEGALGAVLTGLMVLLFLRDWRSSLIVVLNIPLAILASVTALWVSGQTINIMTLGGLALAVGILVDEATVTIENIHTRLADGRSLARAASEATAETTLPRFVAMLCILAVFIPAFFMTGAAHNLFVPLALAVGFSMVGSYLLSSCACRKSNADVLVVQPAENWAAKNLPSSCDGTRERRILLQGEMRAGAIVICYV